MSGRTKASTRATCASLVEAYSRGYRVGGRNNVDRPYADVSHGYAWMLGWIERATGLPHNPPSTGAEARRRHDAHIGQPSLLVDVERAAVDASARGTLL